MSSEKQVEPQDFAKVYRFKFVDDCAGSCGCGIEDVADGDYVEAEDFDRILAAFTASQKDLSYWKAEAQRLSSRVDEYQAKEAEAIEALARVREDHEKLWFNEIRPIINAIGDISVQEAMDAVERMLKEGR